MLCFEAISGLLVNLFKSEIVLVGTVSNISGLANILSCKVSSLPLGHLGLSLGAPHKSVSIWDGVSDKI